VFLYVLVWLGRCFNARQPIGIEDMGHPTAASFYIAGQGNALVMKAVATIKARKKAILSQACPPNAFPGTEVSVDVAVHIDIVEPPLKCFTEPEMRALMNVQRLAKNSMDSVLDLALPSRSNPHEMETVYGFPLEGHKAGEIAGRDVTVKTVLTLNTQTIILDRALNTWVEHGKVIYTGETAQFLGGHGIGSVLAGKGRASLDEFLAKFANSRKPKPTSLHVASPSHLQGRAAGEIQVVSETPPEENIYEDLSVMRERTTPMKTMKSSSEQVDVGIGSIVGDEALDEEAEDAGCDEKNCAGSIGESLQHSFGAHPT
jgi:hypothetical protein